MTETLTLKKAGDVVRHVKNDNWGKGVIRRISKSGKSALVRWYDGVWRGYTALALLEVVNH